MESSVYAAGFRPLQAHSLQKGRANSWLNDVNALMISECERELICLQTLKRI